MEGNAAAHGLLEQFDLALVLSPTLTPLLPFLGEATSSPSPAQGTPLTSWEHPSVLSLWVRSHRGAVGHERQPQGSWCTFRSHGREAVSVQHRWHDPD